MGTIGIFCHGATIHSPEHGDSADVRRSGCGNVDDYTLDIANNHAIYIEASLESVP